MTFFSIFFDYDGRISYNNTIIRNAFIQTAVGTDPYIITNCYIAIDSCARTGIKIVAYYRCSTFFFIFADYYVWLE